MRDGVPAGVGHNRFEDTFEFLNASHLQTAHVDTLGSNSAQSGVAISRPQISRAYSRTVRSLEKRPMRATLRMALRVHNAGSRYSREILRCIARYDAKSASTK